MIIGVDGVRLTKHPTGVGRYTIEIMSRLDECMPNDNFILYGRKDLDVCLPSARWRIFRDESRPWSKAPKSYWVRYRLPSLMSKLKPDVLWAPNTVLPLQLRENTPCVMTVHDFRYLISPAELEPLIRHAYRKWSYSDIRRATRVVANSEGTADRMYVYTGRRADAVAMPGASLTPAFNGRERGRRLEEAGVRRPFFMTIGGGACKNLPIAIDAVAGCKEEGLFESHQLVLAGRLSSRVNKEIATRNRQAWVAALGYVDDELLCELYANADALIFPSSYEGFGIPVLEARAFGCPVVATDSQELREAGGMDAVYIKPTREDVIEGLKVVAVRGRTAALVNPNENWIASAGVMAAMFQEAGERRSTEP